MGQHFSAANFEPATASWPVFGVWSVERGPATLDTSEICSPEATVVKSYHPFKVRHFVRTARCANSFAWFSLAAALYLDAAQRRLRTSSGGNAELQPAQAAQVCSCATRRRRYLVSHRLECLAVLSAEKTVELR